MKKIVVYVVAWLLTFTAAVGAQIVGSVVSTDINTYIDHILVPSYNIGGSTVVMVRDLESYGYMVTWDEHEKTVNFYRDFSKPQEPLIPTYSSLPVGTKLFDVYSTDIRVYFRGSEIPAYNVNGRTAVLIRDLNVSGSVLFDQYKKQVDIFNMDVEYFDDEIEYIKSYFFTNLLLLSEGDHIHQRLMPAPGQYDFNVGEEFDSYADRLSAAVEAFKNYKEPYGFSASSMELWWAMVNMKYATDTIQEMAKNGQTNPDMRAYNQYRADSYEQRRASLVLLTEDIMGLLMFWN